MLRAALLFLFLFASEAECVLSGDYVSLGRDAGRSVSLDAARTRIVRDCDGSDVLESYIRMDFPEQGIVEVQQWNFRAGGREYRVQDTYDYGPDGSLVDQ